MANVQIPEEVFFRLFRYHCIPHEVFTPEELDKLEQKIQQDIETKLDKMVMRNLYTESKTAASPEEREKARQEYLDKRGISKEFRW